jgi:hypothetical protein
VTPKALALHTKAKASATILKSLFMIGASALSGD